MRNVPTVLSALRNVQPLTDYEAAFNARRRQRIAAVHAGELAGRVLVTVGPAVSLDTGLVVQPSMAWAPAPRSQPRDGRGKFLSKAWLAAAETYSAADVAWFSSPLSSEGK